MTEPVTALVVEDDALIARMIAKVLARETWEVSVVDSVSRAEESLAAGNFAAIILDLMLPSRPGYELIELLRASRPELLRRTIVMTASPGHLKTLDLREIGAAMTKPFDIYELMEHLRRIRSEASSS